MDDKSFLGANIDTRPVDAKQKDIFQQELVASAAPVIWKEKKRSEFRSFLEQEQDGSGSCVAQTIKKLAQILLWLKEKTLVDFSATFIYWPRSNKPDGGMIGVEAFDIWKNQGITLEALLPSQHMSDSQMDAAAIEQYEKDIAAIFKIANHVGLANGDFEGLASTIQQTGKGVMTWFYFNSQEWSDEMPRVRDNSLTIPTGLRHSVAAVDFGLIDGKKYIKIEDSAHFGAKSVRFISEEFYKQRNWFARYPMNFKFQDSTQPTPPTPEPIPVPAKPRYTFTRPLVFIPLNEAGNVADSALNAAQKVDVVALQDILRYEGVFPVNVQSTGYYGATTARAVLAYQKKYAVAPVAELDALQGRRAGEKTIAHLNSKYSQ